MWAQDRSREHSCVHATKFCAATCFNRKLEGSFGHVVAPKDARNDKFWSQIDGAQVRSFMATRKHNGRFRLMTRGEAFRDMTDIARVESILRENRGMLVWIPTRAWHTNFSRSGKWRGESRLWAEIARLQTQYRNARIQISLDPSDSEAMVRWAEFSGFSTMFYGDDNSPAINGSKRCPKTWAGKKEACRGCKGKCFSSNITHVWLKRH